MQPYFKKQVTNISITILVNKSKIILVDHVYLFCFCLNAVVSFQLSSYMF